MTRRWMIVAAIVLSVGLLAIGLFLSIDRLVPPRRAAVTEPAPPPPVATAHITATLFYGSLDGQALVPLRREVPLAEGAGRPGRADSACTARGAPPPLVSVIPAGTSLRAFYVTDVGAMPLSI